jgi:cobyrinic acid a,c-diamide synthase
MFLPPRIPRFITAALRGGAGKTLITVGIVAALRRRGMSAAVFKKGPDYIDAGWLGLAAGCDCYNLDAYLFGRQATEASFFTRSMDKDIAVVEGNRGLFDGVDAAGSYSTAELAKLLAAPLILIVDATKVTRTAAALVLGCRRMDPGLDLRGVILNRVGGERHERILRDAIEQDSGVPVLGSVSKLALENFPQRHLGVLPLHEHPQALLFVEEAAAMAERFIDLQRLLEIASSAPEFGVPGKLLVPEVFVESSIPRLRIGILKDSSFQFYYPENLEALQNTGAQLVEVSALRHAELPQLDALYIGGGFPETHAERLAENLVFKRSLRDAVEKGLPVYAECGGLMYLSRNLLMDENVYPMVGVFPADTVMRRKPQGLGYIRVQVKRPNPFYDVGTVLTGHEFHYSSLTGFDPDADHLCVFEVLRGHGIDGFRDGVCVRNALGTYVHVHALGEPQWAQAVLDMAEQFRAAGRLQACGEHGPKPSHSRI